ncbi:helix-turn-helix domain-containing protein [Chryseobacterium tongliaoense]|uniref:helix-turn-helix domain-containing protein n=1 Tax=Chryseobacterium tongliaoense TaxID=3240933 RepID=UPI003511CB6A
MGFLKFLPDSNLRNHIAFFWVVTFEEDNDPSGIRIYADGCSDIICNAGSTNVSFYPLEGTHQAILLYPGQLYLGGTMTTYGILKGKAGGTLTGIRFWPGGFYALFSQTIEPAVDSTIEFSDDGLCKLMRQIKDLDSRLNNWFKTRSAPTAVQLAGKYDFIYLRKQMYESGGQVTVEKLAAEMCVSNRTLERIFKKNVGISPKDFLQIVRFQEVLKRLQNASVNYDTDAEKESLLLIAFELGYYDHAHLTKEFKKYSGILPSELSHFYKTGISGSQYF